MVSFNTIPSNLRVPIFAVEFDSSNAQQGPSLMPYRALLIGQKTSAGTATANSLQKVTSANQVLGLAGRGSMAHRMAVKWFANNRFTETYLGVLEDNDSGVAATGTLTVTGPATASGTINLYVGGQRVQVAVTKGDAATAIATAIAAAIPAASDLMVTAAAGSGETSHVVTVTCRHRGEVGNGIDLRVNYQDGEALPAGVSIAIAAMGNGKTNPVLANLIAAMGDNWFHIIAHGYSDATSLTALEAELSDRNSGTRMIDGYAITSAAGTTSTLGTLGDSRNSQFTWIAAQPGKSPITPPCEFAAAYAAIVAYYGNIDPARPFQTLSLSGVLPPAEADLFTMEERNLLLFDGIGTSKVVAGGVVQIERPISTYKTNAVGVADTAYLDATTNLSLMYLRYDFRNRMALKYPRHKLANDGTRFGAGQAVLTPKLAKAEAVAWFEEKEEQGLVENARAFRENLVVERNATDPNRLDFLLPPDLINQLIVVAAQIGFRL